MKLVFYSVVLNQHQAPVADEFWELTEHQYAFVELINLCDTKGGSADYSKRPYLIRAWESPESYAKAMELARTAECCVFGGVDALPFQKERMRHGLLSFDMGERWLKKGWKSLASPRLLKWLSAYYLGRWDMKPLYKLCMSAFAAGDHYKLSTFKGKCYKWGYFTEVPEMGTYVNTQKKNSSKNIKLMWCARFIDWKHPGLAVECARRLKDNGYDFELHMYGDGPLREQIEHYANKCGLSVSMFDHSISSQLSAYDIMFHGNVPNEDIHKALRDSDIFLFTSDRCEGWGAVANEAMSEGCCLVGGDEIGSVPFLVSHGVNGLIFKSKSEEDLYNKVYHLAENPNDRIRMAVQGQKDMLSIWNPKHAAENLLRLVNDLKEGRDTSITEGPCSKA